jgi:uncharacterized protein YceH (UPF0502 family)
MDADSVELRVLGCLIEKQRTTPDAYPLSLNGLRLACNQTTNRDPIVEYDEPTIRAALEHLSRRGWVRLASGAGSRAAKYRHLLDEALRLSDRELALLAVLMLRGPQTPGELKQRTERLHAFGSLDEVEQVLGELIERELAVHLERRPGQKEARYGQLLGGDVEPEPAAAQAPTFGPAERLAELEARLTRVEQKLAALAEELGTSEPPDALAVDADDDRARRTGGDRDPQHEPTIDPMRERLV